MTETSPRALLPFRGLLLALFFATGCTHAGLVQRPVPVETAPAPRPAAERRVHTEEGIASYYGAAFDGRRTASGTVFHSSAMTCAHRTLPFGTRVRVTELKTGRSVEVTVTDRGPYVQGRIVDLSAAAARKLGFTSRGWTVVRLQRVD